MKVALNEGLRFTEEWYGSYVTNAALPVWIAGAKGLIGAVTGDDSEEKYTVTFSADPEVTGSVRFERDRVNITIGCVYLSEELHAKAGITSEQMPMAIIGCSNGTVAHEAAHLLYGSIGAHAAALHTLVDWKRPYFSQCFNVIEDLFIEASLRKEFTALSNFVAMKNAFLFSDSAISSTLHSEDWTNFNWVLNLVTMAKELTTSWKATVSKVITDEKVNGLWPIIQLAMTPGLSSDERVNLALQLMDMAISISEANAYSPKPDGALGESLAQVMTGSELMRIVGEAEEAAEANKSMIETVEFLATVDSVDKTGHDLPIIVKRSEASAESLPFDPAFEGIEKLLMRMSVPTTTYGPAKNRGHLMGTRLARIATDGKVFADPMDTTKFDMGIEVVLLVDGSGSMRTPSHRRPLTLFEAALSAAITLKVGLDGARVPASVWAHSGDVQAFDYMDCVTMVEVAGTRPVGKATLSRAAAWTATSPLMLSQNRDGDAIRWCTSKAFKTAKRKVLIVLSDGTPAANYYSGSPADADTKNAIAAARRSGVTVFAVSLVSSVVTSNNELYGSEFNVNASSGDIAKAIATIIVNNTRKDR